MTKGYCSPKKRLFTITVARLHWCFNRGTSLGAEETLRFRARLHPNTGANLSTDSRPEAFVQATSHKCAVI